MKVLTLNINPPDKSQIDISMLSDHQRISRIIELIDSQNPDIVFFIEQWCPVYGTVRKILEGKGYTFYSPTGFEPAYYKNGKYPSFAGVIAAVKTKYTVVARDGQGLVNKTAKWLSLEINSTVYLGVHYPQPDEKAVNAWNTFHQAVTDYSKNVSPSLIIGDFNTPRGMAVIFEGYRDVLAVEPTCSSGKKLDYIFLKEGLVVKHEELINSVRFPENSLFFSDHSVTSATLLIVASEATAPNQ